MLIRQFFSVFLLLILCACGGGGGDGSSASTSATDVSLTPASVEISSRSALLSAPGQTQLLTARVYNAAGQEISAAVTWESSRPSEVSVSATGLLTATGSGGSSQIVARAGDVRSRPLLAVHTALPSDALLLTDANILGEPVETSPGSPGSMNNTYQVSLTGVAAPEAGRLVINTGDKVVAGRVVAVRSDAGVHTVTLALVPARTLFPQLQIDEVLDLSQAEVAVPARIQSMYEVQRNGDQFTFTPKSGAISLGSSTMARRQSVSGRATAQALGDDFNLGPFTCKPVVDGAAGAGSEVLSLTLPPVFTVAINPRLELRASPSGGLERFVLHAEPTASIEVGLKTLLAVEGKITCEAELFVIQVPVGGPLAYVVGGQIPVGVGAELGGKLTVLNMGISGKGTLKTTGALGLSCLAPAGCGLVHEFGPVDASLAPVIDAPSLSDARLEPSLSLYATIKTSLGNPFFKSLRFDAFKAKAGLALKGNFAPASVQMADSSYQSDYKLVAEVKAGADTGYTGLKAFLGLNAFAETLLEVSADLITTPVGTLAADKARVDAFETVKFKVQLDPTKVNALRQYNVEQVLLMRHRHLLDATEVARLTAAPGQTEFNFEFRAPDVSAAGRSDEFYAFVVTKMLPIEKLPLELGQASAIAAPTGDRISAGEHHTCALTSAGGVKCWGHARDGALGNGTGTPILRLTPVDVSGLGSGGIAVSAGSSHTCALTSAGGAKCWGFNGVGALGDGTTTTRLTPVDVSGLGSGVLAVSAGLNHTCALTNPGGVKCWGENRFGKLGDGSTAGRLTPVDVSGLGSGVLAISAGGSHTCALTSAGGVKCWGNNVNGAVGDGSTTNRLTPVDVSGLGSGVIAISASQSHTCALTSAGGVKCWGYNALGPLGDGTTTTRLTPVDVSGLSSGVIAISSSRHGHTCALTSAGGVKCWGNNPFGQLGDGSTTNTLTPVDVSGLGSGVIAVSAGIYHTCALTSAGGAKCWGHNAFGVLGDGSTTNSTTPVAVIGFP